MIQEVAAFIAAKASLTIGTDLFEGHRPQGTIDACDLLQETAGGTIFFDLHTRADVIFSVLSRAKNYVAARTRAYAIYDAIFRDWTLGAAGFTLPVVTGGEEYEAMIIEPLAPPQYIGQDEKSRFEFSVNYIFKLLKL